ncbi:phosphoribulokinase [Actinidia rufa]|uniref:Phosphoribulokinase n=1 Tax=Actinidia rufa TaxID=165716 RepID=A0A7J0GT23_9ERIC|nr:phosphoribulokinase [Actinidia rufa]
MNPNTYYAKALFGLSVIVLTEKPVISEDLNQLDSSLIDELLANIATLSFVYHKPPDAFVICAKTGQRTEEDDYLNRGEKRNSEPPSHPVDSAAPPLATSSNASHAAARQPVAAPPVLVPDLLGN